MDNRWEKGQEIELTIRDMSVDGQGIGRTEGDSSGTGEGLVVFVSGAVTGDRVRARLNKVRKNMAYGHTVEILEKSPLRNGEFDCPGFAEGCGGCPCGQLEYAAQLEMKQRQVENRLKRIGGLKDPLIRPIIGMTEEDNGGQGPWRYRNKASFPVSTGGIVTKKGGIVESLGQPAVGFYRARTHQVVDCPDCYLQSMAAMAAADALRSFMAEDNITGYDPRWEKGLIRHLIVRSSFRTGEVMVILVINGKGIPGAPKLVDMLDEAIAAVGFSLESVVLNIHKASGKNVEKNKGRSDRDLIVSGEMLGDEYVCIAGKPVITDWIGNLKMEISPASFYQVNPVQMKRLYDVVRDYCKRPAGAGEKKQAGDAPENGRPGEAAEDRQPAETGALEPSSDREGAVDAGPVILDLYCGVGSIGLYCADLARMVIGIESVKEAVTDANRNAVINGITRARFLCGRAEEILPACLGSGEKSNSPGGASSRPGRSGRPHGKPFDPAKVDPELLDWIRRADTAILDPPRAGCRRELLEAVAESGVEKIIYVSCDPATLARDVKILCELGYAFEEARPVDMFPGTGHVEAVTLLSRAK